MSLEAGGLLQTTVHAGSKCVEPDALLAVADRMLAVGFWCEAAALWSAQSVAIDAEVQEEQTTPQLKLALIGKRGAVRNKKDEAIGWDEFIKIPGLLATAGRGKRGKYKLWLPSEVTTWAARNGYAFEKLQGKPEGGKTDTSPMGQIVHRLKSR